LLLLLLIKLPIATDIPMLNHHLPQVFQPLLPLRLPPVLEVLPVL